MHKTLTLVHNVMCRIARSKSDLLSTNVVFGDAGGLGWDRERWTAYPVASRAAILASGGATSASEILACNAEFMVTIRVERPKSREGVGSLLNPRERS